MMKSYNSFLTATFLALTLSCVTAEDKQRDADNTSRNQRDKSGETKTPMDQSNAPEDRKLVAAIRKLVVDDSSLSATAKNCKIITNGGHVTLRGVVNSAQEKTTIESHATKSAGKDKVDNQLEVKAGN